jgi:hypothetical protein
MSKKLYSKPTLTVHGSVEKLTLGTGEAGFTDTNFNSFTGNTFNDVGISNVCTFNPKTGKIGSFGCP